MLEPSEDLARRRRDPLMARERVGDEPLGDPLRPQVADSWCACPRSRGRARAAGQQGRPRRPASPRGSRRGAPRGRRGRARPEAAPWMQSSRRPRSPGARCSTRGRASTLRESRGSRTGAAHPPGSGGEREPGDARGELARREHAVSSATERTRRAGVSPDAVGVCRVRCESARRPITAIDHCHGSSLLSFVLTRVLLFWARTNTILSAESRSHKHSPPC